MGWQDSLVYRWNALVWVLYAVLPSVTMMCVWIAAYGAHRSTAIGGFSLSRMMTYYLCVTTLSVIITPHPEWEISQQIRNGLITQFMVKPIDFFTYRAVQETAYQIVKSIMLIPSLIIMVLLFHQYIVLPTLSPSHFSAFLIAVAIAYVLLCQLKFLMGISAFWIAEPGGFMEIWNVLTGVFAGRLLPLALLPGWMLAIGTALPFSSLYAFPMRLLLGAPTSQEIALGFARQTLWLAALSILVRLAWRNGLRAYEAYGG